MAINPTQPNFKSFTFDGTNSRSFGVYITGQGVFNAPERNVEIIDIAGRNGSYVLDKGNFNNIDITYPAGIYADNETDFATAVSDLRNFLCSKVGYIRLEDDYNPNEYRMAVYKSGLDVSHEMLIAGEFNITFTCKPQRFLKSGETATTITSGSTITNPTLFDASPQLQVWGYGDISLGGQTIKVVNGTFGNILIAPFTPNMIDNSNAITLNVANVNNGDSFQISGAEVKVSYHTVNKNQYRLNGFSVSSATNCSSVVMDSTTDANIRFLLNDTSFSKGTSGSLSASATISAKVTNTNTNTTTTTTVSATFGIAYNSNATVTYTWSLSPSSVANTTQDVITSSPDIFCDSTKSALGNPMYIDLDIGEAYNNDSGTPMPVNDSVQIPAHLPTLPSGATTITYDNTFTQVKIVPRWWQV